MSDYDRHMAAIAIMGWGSALCGGLIFMGLYVCSAIAAAIIVYSLYVLSRHWD